MNHLLALLDRPSSRSFGMLATLIRDTGTGRLLVSGLAGGVRPLTLPSSMTLQEFIDGHCLDVAPMAIAVPHPEKTSVAGWLGDAFLEECDRLQVPPPRTPGPPPYRHADMIRPDAADGVFWIEAAPPLYTRLEAWNRQAALIAYATGNPEVAELMGWCLPEHEETMAARWHTARTPADRQRELAFCLRLHPELADSTAALERRLATIVRRLQPRA